jgi:hypothetical protein
LNAVAVIETKARAQANAVPQKSPAPNDFVRAQAGRLNAKGPSAQLPAFEGAGDFGTELAILFQR